MPPLFAQVTDLIYVLALICWSRADIFFEDVLPEDLAWKMLAVNLSDMAAMGAKPRWVLLSAALPELNQDWLKRFCDSFFALATRFDTVLIGGDTTKGDLVFNVTIVGEVPTGHALRRDAAEVGDDIWVSGRLGLAAAALNKHLGHYQLPSEIMAVCDEKLLRPEPRVSLGQALLPFAHAAQDVSDGLAQDVGHILKASAVGAEIFADCVPSLPELKNVLSREQWLSAVLAGGDDYELIFTAAPEDRERVCQVAEQSGVPVARIGKMTDSGRLNILDAEGGVLELTSLGFDHFG